MMSAYFTYVSLFMMLLFELALDIYESSRLNLRAIKRGNYCFLNAQNLLRIKFMGMVITKEPKLAMA